jgi:hypothetical protein
VKMVNATGMAAGATLGMESNGAERLVVAVKGTFTLPLTGEIPELAAEQLRLTDADEFVGAPGLSAVTSECDWAPRKARCDILLNGSAHAPDGKPTNRINVGIRIGGWHKVFAVVGDRVWRTGPVTRVSEPEPFDVKPISYGNAFGGVDNFHPDERQHRTYLQNPVGLGYHHVLDPYLVDGTPLPNTEESNAPVMTPNGGYRPMAFGPVGRNFSPRCKFAGTYDQNWIDNVFPFLPTDFNPRYFQAAPEDQQVEKISGGEPVTLLNLTPDGRRVFLLPSIDVPVVFFLHRGREEAKATIDTLTIEPDAGRFCLVWRASLLLKRNIFEVKQVVVGQMSRTWWRAQKTGKTYYSSLGKLVQARRMEAEDVE